MFYFISGGVRSGKSTYAEQLAVSLSKTSDVIYYIATSIAYDEEMRDRIKRHQVMRSNHPVRFITFEKPTHIEQLIERFNKNDVVLIDCLTTLLSNELFQGFEVGEENWRNKQARIEIIDRLTDTFVALKRMGVNVILVSNELGYDRLPNDESTICYLKMLGLLHQKIVTICDYAILVEFGIPIYKKRCD